MKRYVLGIFVCLLFGAIVNLAVAWGCVLWSDRVEVSGSCSPESVQQWEDYWAASDLVRRLGLTLTDNPSETFQRRYRFRYAHPSHVVLLGRGIEQTAHACTFVDDDQSHPLGAGLEVRAGWPLASLVGTAIYDRTLPGNWKRSGAIAIPRIGNEWMTTGLGWRDLPLRPVLLGFVANSLFHAAVLVLLVAVPFTLRRWRRIERGLCPECAYPIGVSSVCSECGRPVAANATRGIPAKKWSFRIFLFLIGGAVVNVVVAWLGAAATPIPPPPPGGALFSDAMPKVPLDAATRRWIRGVDRRYGRVDGAIVHQTHWTWPADQIVVRIFDPDYHERQVVLLRMDAGWPLRAIQTSNDRRAWRSCESASEFLSLSARSLMQRPTEFGPIWPGFAINTVFYAVGLWGLFAGPFVLRRRRRIRRGLCPKCAYDLRGKTGGACPECGSIVAS